MCVSAATCGVRHSYVAAWEVVKRWKYVYLGAQGFKSCFCLNSEFGCQGGLKIAQDGLDMASGYRKMPQN